MRNTELSKANHLLRTAQNTRDRPRDHSDSRSSVHPWNMRTTYWFFTKFEITVFLQKNISASSVSDTKLEYVDVVHEITVLQSPLTDAGGVTTTHRLRCWMYLRVSRLADSDYSRERRWHSECGATCTLRRELAPPALHSRVCGSGLTLGITIDLCICVLYCDKASGRYICQSG